MPQRTRVTGDSPNNRRDERGSKGSCMETLAVGGLVVALLSLLSGWRK